MSYGRRDVWLAGFVAFVAWGLAVQALPVLRFIGYAFNFGVLTTLIVLVAATLLISRPLVPRSAHVPPSTPAFVSPSLWKLDRRRYERAQEYRPVQLYPESVAVSQALDNIITFVLRDFISSWYSKISSSPAFRDALDENIRAALINVKDRLLRQDIPGFIIARIVPIIKNHLKDFDQAERLVRGKASNRNLPESEELDLAIAAKYKDGHLHSAASLAFSDTKGIQQDYIRKTLVRILPDVLSEKTIGSRAVFVLIKEIAACAVLFPILKLLADPDTWNQIIEGYGRRTLQDRKTVKRMRAALDEHTSPVVKSQAPFELPKLAPDDSERAFERFVRAIRKTKTLADARRFRSQLASQLAKENTAEGQDPVYIRRLEMGKRVLEQKIAKLANLDVNSINQVIQDNRNGRVSKARELPLVKILHTASGLSYFMEYMDRRQRMSLVQFWIVVDGFRNPLEDDFGDDATPGVNITWTDTDRLDIAQISETYMGKPEMNVPVESQEEIRTFLTAGRKATPEQYRAARVAILTAQSAVLEEMETNHFPQFKKSDLYYKFLASDEASSKDTETRKDTESSAMAALSKNMQAPTMIRSSSQPSFRTKDLRRAAVSSTDIKTLANAKLPDLSNSNRRSHESHERPPLFDDDYDTDHLGHSTASIGSESINGDTGVRVDVIENMEAALTDIVASPTKDIFGDEQDGLFSPVEPIRLSRKSTGSPTTSSDAAKFENVTDKARPSLATLGLVNTSSRIGVFTDNDLFPDEEKFAEDEYADPDIVDQDPESEIHEAAPGDLGLAEAITLLTHEIEKLVAQESVVDTLTRKAELTNNVAELRILAKSKASLQREIRRKELQRQQYIVQESDNSLYGRSSIHIKSVMVGKEDDGNEFAMYVIEVRRQAGDQMSAATWAVTKRYSEFHELHQRLRRRYPSTRNLEFPRRRMVMKLQKQFLHNRRIALESYLQHLLHMPDVCRSREFRSFLSQQAIISESMSNSSETQDIVTRIYNSVTDGMDEFLGNIAVLDQLSSAGQNLVSAATSQTNIPPNSGIISVGADSVAEAEAELKAFEEKELEPFVKPICDIFLEMFELNRGNNWLRGRAVVVVLHQLLGGTVERKIRDSFKSLVAEDALLGYIDTLKETMWSVDGSPKEATRPRTTAEKSKSRTEAGAVLSTLVPDLVGSVVGRTNAQVAAKRIVASMNNKRLNEHLVLCLYDEIVALLFDLPVTARRVAV